MRSRRSIGMAVLVAAAALTTPACGGATLSGTSPLPSGGITSAQAVAAAQKEVRWASTTPARTVSVRAGPLSRFRGTFGAQYENRLVWDVVLSGTFPAEGGGLGQTAPLGVNHSAEVQLDYHTGEVLFTEMPAGR